MDELFHASAITLVSRYAEIDGFDNFMTDFRERKGHLYSKCIAISYIHVYVNTLKPCEVNICTSKGMAE